MISYLKGTIKAKGSGWLIVNTGSVGYKVFCSPFFWAEAKEDGQIELFCHEVLRQDGRELYGFREFSELELFEVLISVTGIGPKSGLAILTLGKPLEIKSAIARGDAHFFTRVSGIGRKTAGRLLLELKDKFDDEGASVAPGMDEVAEALTQLGYGRREAVDAAQKVGSEGSIEERIRRALKA